MKEIVADWDGTEHLLLRFARSYGQSAGLPDLRALSPTSAELHLRIWQGFGLTGVEGLAVSGAHAGWTAQMIVSTRRSECYAQRPAPSAADWGRLWRDIEGGLSALPARPPRDPNWLVMDGHSYVVEWWAAGRYRTFVYDNPQVFRTPDDVQMMAIAREIFGAAGVRTPME
jgi:hypothetical protein